MPDKIPFFKFLFISAAFLVSIPGACLAQPGNNAKINEQDTHLEELIAELTADQQSETKPLGVITQKNRQAIVSDKSLSTDAHNVKIITDGGTVTLKGSVRSEKEKGTIEEKASRKAGNGNIKSEIGITP